MVGIRAASAPWRKAPVSSRVSPLSVVLLSLAAVLVGLVLLVSAAMLHPPTAERVHLALSGTETVELRTLPDADGNAPDAEGTARTAELLQGHLDGLDSGWTRVTPVGGETIEVEVRASGGTGEITEFLGHFEEPSALSVHPVVGVPGEAPSLDEALTLDDIPEGITPEEMEEFLDASADGSSADPAEVEMTLPDEAGTMLQLGAAAVSSGDVEGAETRQADGRWMVTVHFHDEAHEAWRELTGDAACFEPGDPRRRIAIVMDGLRLVSAPEVGPGTTCGAGLTDSSTVITSPSFDQESAAALTLEILGAALPFPFEVVSAGSND